MTLELSNLEAGVLRQLVEYKIEDDEEFHQQTRGALLASETWTEEFVSVAKKLGVNIDD